jgi:membrane protease YdiL (CAAX protease family)
MNPLAKIGIYLALVGFCAISLSPPIYWLIHAFIDHGFSVLGFLETFPFHRYFSRTLQVSALILAVPLILWLRVRSLHELGLEKNQQRWGDLARGLTAAMVPMTILGVALLFWGVYQFRDPIEWSKLPRIIGTAAVVSCLEEFFFRAVLLGLAVRALGAPGGIALSTMVFAAVHFLRPARLPDTGPVTWMSGWDQLFSFVHGLPSWPLLAAGVFTLLLSGWILAWTVLRTRSLWMAVGLHAGWVFGQQSLQLVAKYEVRPPESLLPWIGPNLVSGAVPTGILPMVALALAAAILAILLRHRT